MNIDPEALQIIQLVFVGGVSGLIGAVMPVILAKGAKPKQDADVIEKIEAVSGRFIDRLSARVLVLESELAEYVKRDDETDAFISSLKEIVRDWESNQVSSDGGMERLRATLYFPES